jgi:hypothetical protein
LFTHPATGLAFKEGEATDVARVAACAAAVAVAPMFMAVGSTDIAGTVRDTYVLRSPNLRHSAESEHPDA